MVKERITVLVGGWARKKGKMGDKRKNSWPGSWIGLNAIPSKGETGKSPRKIDRMGAIPYHLDNSSPGQSHQQNARMTIAWPPEITSGEWVDLVGKKNYYLEQQWGGGL